MAAPSAFRSDPQTEPSNETGVGFDLSLSLSLPLPIYI